MQVGDLVRVMTAWGGINTLGIVVKVHDVGIEAIKTRIITLHTGWEYRTFELEVLSGYR